MQNDELRIDAEYFKKKYLHEDSDLKKYVCKPLRKLAFISDGQHGYYETDESSNIHMLAARNAKTWFADLDDAIPLAKWVDDCNKRSSLEAGDLILSTRGTVGNCAIINQEVLPANLNQDVARIKITENSFLPEFVLAFLNSCFGQDWLKRNQTGMVQQGISLLKLKILQIPLLSQSFQSQIASLVKSAHAKLLESKSLYSEAEDILLRELGLKDWKPGSKTNVSIKRLSDFAKSGRLDAEYYQGKYDELFKKLSSKNCKNLGDLVSIKKSVEPGSGSYKSSGIPFVRVSDVNKFGITNPSLYLSSDEFNLENLKPQKDTILLSKDGSIGIAYKCEKDLDIITSGALLHLDVKNKNVLPDYLTLVLNSVTVQLQAEREANGALIKHWKPDDIKKVKIPLLPSETQSQIAQKIQRSFALKEESNQLLKQAKSAVEMEIEK